MAAGGWLLAVGGGFWLLAMIEPITDQLSSLFTFYLALVFPVPLAKAEGQGVGFRCIDLLSLVVWGGLFYC